ncbi:hypothetical protein ACIHJG_33955 [Streptomyces sp. NPDC052415]|uniref:hypothetical protein n=1 Tax=Streptomyces sp. NPDC052415 TaxID=3365690 RepID=UPI0037D6AFCE
MRAHTDLTVPAPQGRGLQPPAYGVTSSSLLARADRGFARIQAQHTDRHGHADAGENPQQ